MTDSSLVVYWHEQCLSHVVPDGAFSLPGTELLAVDEPHPDRPARLSNVKRLVERTLADVATITSAPPATDRDLAAVHDTAYLESLRACGASGPVRLTPTTVATTETYDAARHAAGASIAAAEHAVTDGIDPVPYALIRPSGHHAQPAQADGFCFVNNVAVAAERLRATGQADRVAIVDWDVHHGNGTQEIFYDRDDVLVVSLHNDHGSWDAEYHPQTGSRDERGVDDGEGYTVNVPLPFGTGDDGYAAAFDRLVEPVVTQFDPDLLLVSAGQDPGARDPLGRNVVTTAGFRRLGSRVRQLAESTAGSRLALIQEGGYQLTHFSFSTLAVLAGAGAVDPSFQDVNAEYDLENDPFAWPSANDSLAAEWIQRAVRSHAAHWDL
ncbi:MAG: class II histone deacetylase [Halolamina sp.]